MFAAGDQFTQVGEHLAAVAHTQGKGIGAGKEGAEVFPGLGIEQDRLGPAFTGTEYVTVGETTTSHQAAEVFQVHPAAKDVAHVHVNSGETGAGKCGGHFGLTIHALLAQNGNARTRAAADVGRGDVFIDIEAEQCLQTRIGVVGQQFELLVGAVRIVAQALDVPAGFTPGALPVCPGAGEHVFIGKGEPEVLRCLRLTDHGAAVAQARCGQLTEYGFGIALAHLNHRAQLFIEQYRRQLAGGVGQYIELDFQAAVAGKGHLGKSSQQTTVGTVVVGQQQFILVQSLDHGEESLEVFGVIQIRCVLADAVIHLGQRRAAEAVPAATQIDQDQVGSALVQV